MSPFVHLIADYGESDPAFSEVVHRLTYHERDIDVQTTEVPPFSTVATGFWIEQLGLHNSAFDDLLVYSNTAPRTEESTPARPDEGGRLCYLELDNGVPVVAVDAGYNLAFVRDHVREFRVIETDHSGGQFRSRDTFPEYVVDLATGIVRTSERRCRPRRYRKSQTRLCVTSTATETSRPPSPHPPSLRQVMQCRSRSTRPHRRSPLETVSPASRRGRLG